VISPVISISPVPLISKPAKDKLPPSSGVVSLETSVIPPPPLDDTSTPPTVVPSPIHKGE